MSFLNFLDCILSTYLATRFLHTQRERECAEYKRVKIVQESVGRRIAYYSVAMNIVVEY